MNKNGQPPIDTPDKLNAKQVKLMGYLLDGLDDKEALTKAGYSVNCRAIISRIRPLFEKLLEEKQKKMVEETITKGQCVQLLRDIAIDKTNPKVQIMAMTLLGRFLSFEAPIKTENKNENNITILRFEEDK